MRAGTGAEATSVAVRAARVRGDQQFRGVWVAGPADGGRPAADGRHRERSGVAVVAHRHPAGVGAQVVDPVGHGLARLAGEVVDLNPSRVPARAPAAALVGVLADQLLLLRIEADHRLAVGHSGADLVVDIAELGVSVGVLAALDGLGVALQAVPQRPAQQPPDAVVGDSVALAAQLVGQVAGRLGGPPKLEVPAYLRVSR